jgi:SagB-type dehydrogenase family enzyme
MNTRSRFEPKAFVQDDSVLEIYHENSKLKRSDIATFARIGMINESTEIRRVISKPFPRFRRTVRTPLLAVCGRGKDFVDIVRRRRSVREYTGRAISLAQLSCVLQIGDGMTGSLVIQDGSQWPVRSAPSPGGLFPTRIFCAAFAVEGLEPGLHYFDVTGSALDLVADKHDLRDELARITAMHATMRTAACCLILTFHPARIRFKYGERSYRFALLEAGHIAQNLLLAAEYEGLGAVALGGFIDDEVNSLCGFRNGEEVAVYLIAMGEPVSSQLHRDLTKQAG